MATKGYTDYEIVAGAYPGVSGDFVNEQRNRRGFGVSNVEATATTNLGQRTRKSQRRSLNRTANEEGIFETESERRSRVTSYKRRKQREMAYSAIENSLPEQSWIRTAMENRRKNKATVKKAAAPVLNAVIAGTWAYVFLYTASVFGILFLILFFGTAIIEELLWGLTIDSLRFGAYACYGAQLFFSALVIIGMLGQFKITGLNALGGKGAAVKQILFILAMLPMLIPGGPFFIPSYTPWLFAVTRYPR
jgi:hypothetical protein